MSTIASTFAAPSPQSYTADKPASDALTSKDTFLKLLVAQIKNQDPTNPTDATQFVGQLTQYSELEQLIQINQGLTKVETPATTVPAA